MTNEDLAAAPYDFQVSFDLVDAGGVVYHPNYFILLERARYDYCAKIGIDAIQHFLDGFAFVVADIKSQFKAPLMLKQNYRIVTEIVKASKKTLNVEQSIFHKDKELFRAELVLVHVSMKEMRSLSMPNEILDKFETHSRLGKSCHPNCKNI